LNSSFSSYLASGHNQGADKGARLSCHLLLRLFQSVHVLPGSEARKNALSIKSSCDRHLLEAAHSSITVGAVVAVLKAILVLGKKYCFLTASICSCICLLLFQATVVIQIARA
jgi:hypothetical protein